MPMENKVRVLPDCPKSRQLCETVPLLCPLSLAQGCPLKTAVLVPVRLLFARPQTVPGTVLGKKRLEANTKKPTACHLPSDFSDTSCVSSKRTFPEPQFPRIDVIKYNKLGDTVEIYFHTAQNQDMIRVTLSSEILGYNPHSILL